MLKVRTQKNILLFLSSSLLILFLNDMHMVIDRDLFVYF